MQRCVLKKLFLLGQFFKKPRNDTNARNSRKEIYRITTIFSYIQLSKLSKNMQQFFESIRSFGTEN